MIWTKIKVARCGAVLGIIGSLAGCHSWSGTPSFLPFDPGGSKPTVEELLQHTACEVGKAMDGKLGQHRDALKRDGTQASEDAWNKLPADGKLWTNLINYNYVAVVALQLEVTNNEGLNPALNVIQPYAPYATPGLPGGMPTPFAGNVSLAVGAQLDGSQDRILAFTFNMDMPRVWEDLDQVTIDKPWISARTGKKIVSRDEKAGNDGPLIFDCNAGTQIYGDLGLDEILEDGLYATDTTKAWNVYSVPTADLANGMVVPQPTVSAAGLQTAIAKVKKAKKLQLSAQIALSTVDKVAKAVTPKPGQAPAAPAAPAAHPPSLNITSPTSTYSKVMFTVTEGINGGPNWTLRHFTGPGGGSGSGGGGKGAGSGGAGGGSGGGGQGLLNMNRVAIDTLQIEMSATCFKPTLKNPGTPASSFEAAMTAWQNPHDYWESLPPCRFAEGQIQRANSLQQMRSELNFRLQ